MTPDELTAWRIAGDLLLDDAREGDDWGLAREALALRILANLRAALARSASAGGPSAVETHPESTWTTTRT